jgi:transposase InsO family protein
VARGGYTRFYSSAREPAVIGNCFYHGLLIVLAHDRRRIVHFNVAEPPTAEWTGQQMAEAFCDGKSPRYLMRDRDGVYGLTFRDRVKALDIGQVVIAPHSPWQNPYVERVIGTLRRGCVDHVVVLGESHLSYIVRRFLSYYHTDRTHNGLEKDTPAPRPVAPKPMATARFFSYPRVGGLHHRYDWQQAA